MRVKERYSTAEIMTMLELSRHQVYRLKKRCGCGRWLYLNKLREHMPDLFDSMVLAGRVGQSNGEEEE
jgi:hypothetical protein